MRLTTLLCLVWTLGGCASVTSESGRHEYSRVLMGVKARIVPGRLEAMADQLEARIGRGESFPTNWEGWLERDFSSVPEDPWDNYYYLQVSRRDFTVGSMGPDGRPNTGDDIKVTRRLAGR